MRAAALLGDAGAPTRLTVRKEALEAQADVLAEVGRLLTLEAAAATAADPLAVVSAVSGGDESPSTPPAPSPAPAAVSARSAVPVLLSI